MPAVSLIHSVLKLLTGVVIFLGAVKIFTGCLEKNFSHKMRGLFGKMRENRWAAVGVGAGATALMQSSTAATVMTVGLVNAGILTLFQATAVIMGANVGTTVTSLMVSLSTLQIKYIFMALFFAGAALRINTKYIIAANFLIGFGGIFIGLEFIGMAFSGSEFLQNIFTGLFERVTFPLLLVLLGAVFTGIIQSSSASVAVYMGMLSGGVLDFNSAVFLVFGSEIGTCFTTLLASLNANTNAKRAALTHLLFNVLSAAIFTMFLWPLGGYLIPFYERLVPNPVWQLSVFQVLYNVAATLILIWFIAPLNRLVCFLVKERS